MAMAQPVMSLPQDPQSPGPLSRKKSLLRDPASVRKGVVSWCPPQSVPSPLTPGPNVCVGRRGVCVCVCVCVMEVFVCVCVCVCVCEGRVCV